MKDAPSGYRPTIPDAVRKNITDFTPEQVYFFARYACALFDGYEPPTPPTIDPLLLKIVCGEIDERQAYIDEVCRCRVASGRKGGASKAARQRQANLASVASVASATSIGEESKGKESKERECVCSKGAQSAPHTRTHGAFNPPTVEEVRAYAEAQGLSVDAAAFLDYYAAQGWKRNSGLPISDWRAALRTWARGDGEREDGPKPRKRPPPPDIPRRADA